MPLVGGGLDNAFLTVHTRRTLFVVCKKEPGDAGVDRPAGLVVEPHPGLNPGARRRHPRPAAWLGRGRGRRTAPPTCRLPEEHLRAARPSSQS